MIKKNLNYRDKDISGFAKEILPPDLYKIILDNIPVLCVDLVILKNKKVFLIKRKNKPCEGIYWVQGGRMYKNESMEDCGKRRTASELAIPIDKIKIKKCLGTFSTEFKDSHQGSASHTVNVTFLAEIDDMPLSFDADHSDGKWFDVNGEIPDDIKGKYEHHPYISGLLQLISEEI